MDEGRPVIPKPALRPFTQTTCVESGWEFIDQEEIIEGLEYQETYEETRWAAIIAPIVPNDARVRPKKNHSYGIFSQSAALIYLTAYRFILEEQWVSFFSKNLRGQWFFQRDSLPSGPWNLILSSCIALKELTNLDPFPVSRCHSPSEDDLLSQSLERPSSPMSTYITQRINVS